MHYVSIVWDNSCFAYTWRRGQYLGKLAYVIIECSLGFFRYWKIRSSTFEEYHSKEFDFSNYFNIVNVNIKPVVLWRTHLKYRFAQIAFLVSCNDFENKQIAIEIIELIPLHTQAVATYFLNVVFVQFSGA